MQRRVAYGTRLRPLAWLMAAMLAMLLAPTLFASPQRSGSASQLVDTSAVYFQNSTWQQTMTYAVGRTAGDVNGDGYDDVLVFSAAPDSFNPRIVRLFLGSASGPSSSYVWQISAVEGTSAGDVNRDGYDDVIVYTGSNSFALYRGTSTGLAASSSWSYAVPAGESRNLVGGGKRHGDVNNDGYSDVILGHVGGTVMLFVGSATGLSSTPRWSYNTSLWHNGGFIGDVNADSFEDFAIGEWTANGDQGRLLVFYGRSGSLPTSASITINGSGNARFGTNFAPGGDVTGDGYADLLVSAYGAESGSGSAQRFVYAGSSSGISTTPWLSVSEDWGIGWITGIGDINGDRCNEYAVGNPWSSDLKVWEGCRQAGAQNLLWSVQTGSHFGWPIDAADIDADRRVDLIVGAHISQLAQVFMGGSMQTPPMNDDISTSLTVPTTWLTGPTVTVQFTATSTSVAVDAAKLRLGDGAWSAWIDIAAGVTSSATLALGADGSAIPVSLVVRDADGAYSAVRSASLKVDRTPPGSSMTALAAVSSSAIALAWSGSDATSGVASYDVQVQADGGAWSTVLSGTSATSTTYTGAADVTYGFRVRARDAAGNVEAWPASAETSTLVDLTGPSGAVVLNGGVPATAVRTVDLALSASDTQSGVAEVRISDDGGSSWSAWQAYAASVDHTLPAGDGTKTVTVQFRDAVGNLSATRSDSITLDEAVGPEYGIALNRNALFTNVVTVEVMVGAPAYTREVMISNNGNFGGASWRPFDTRIDWEITSYGTSALPRVVYVKYKARDGTVSSTYLDDIILDQTAPVMQSLTSRLAPEAGDELAAPEERAAAVPSLDPAAVWRIYVPRLASYGIPIALSVRASDDYSGVSEVQFSASSDFSRAWWQPYPTTGNAVWYAPSRPQQVWARVRDKAGNISSNVVSVRLP